MILIIPFFIISLILFGNFAMAQNNPSTLVENLKEKIVERINDTEGNFAVAFKDLQTDESIFINEKETFHAASTMKTPVMIEVFKQAAKGLFSLDDSILIKNEFRSIVDSSTYSLDISEDSGEELYKSIGKKKTIYDLIYDMITVSSNLATNILIELIDAKNVMKTMKEIGAEQIKVLRGVEDQKAFDLGLNNTTSVFDLMLIFEAISKGKVISNEACDAMVKILLEQKFRSKIPAKLPKEVKVANKTGSITGVEHDSGIVFLPDGRKYIIVLLSKNLKNANDGIEAEAEISKLIYDYMVSVN